MSDSRLQQLKRAHEKDPTNTSAEIEYLTAILRVDSDRKAFFKEWGVRADDRLAFLSKDVGKPPAEFIAQYPHSWGKGATAEEAKKQARKHGGRGSCWVIFKIPEWGFDSWVDGLGRAHWKWTKGYINHEWSRLAPRAQVVKYGRQWKGRKE